MAFDRTQMSALCYNNGFTLWHYRAPDDFGVVIASGYFDEWAEYLRPGDMIILNATDKFCDDSLYNDYVFVRSIQDGVVSVS